MELAACLSLILIASSPIAEDSWALTLLNYGVAGVMLLFFMWRDRKTEEARTLERSENAVLQRENTNALNLMTRGLMVVVISLKHIDGAEKELAIKIKEQAETHLGAQDR